MQNNLQYLDSEVYQRKFKTLNNIKTLKDKLSTHFNIFYDNICGKVLRTYKVPHIVDGETVILFCHYEICVAGTLSHTLFY